MPGKSAELLNLLQVEPSKRGFGAATYGSDLTYGRSAPKKPNELPFPPLLVVE
jgi:hypothetical protein